MVTCRQDFELQMNMKKEEIKIMPRIANSLHPQSKSGNLVEVSDLYLAVFLKSKHKLQIIDMRKNRDGRLTFILDGEGHDSNDLIRNFYNGHDEVKALDFIRELRDMKALIHNY